MLLKFALLLTAAQAFGGEYIVKLKDKTTSPARFNTYKNLTVVNTHEVGQLIKVQLKGTEEAKTVAQIMKDPAVEYVVEDFRLEAYRLPPSTKALKEQWALGKVNAEKAWNLAGSRGSKNIIVAVIDTGVDYRHEALKPNMVPGYDFLQNDNDPMDETGQNPGHGTHCAGVIGATGLIDGGIIGLSPEVSLMPIRFLGANGGGDLMAGIKSIDFAIKNGAKVISASWGATVQASQAKPLIEAVKRANDAGVIFISAAANDGRNNDVTSVYPANAKFENTITVAASNSGDQKPRWSNYGRASVDVSAPGEQIMSTLPNNRYGNLSGTSMATPLVSGLVALLASKYPEITGAQVRSLMQVTGAKVNIETACNCRIDAGKAVESLLNKTMIVVPAAATIKPSETLQFEAFNGKAPFKFTSSNAQIAEINDSGLLSSKGEGETVVSITDADGKVAQSLNIYITNKSNNGGGGGGGGGGGAPGMPGECPFQNPQMCEMLCKIAPQMPWCNK